MNRRRNSSLSITVREAAASDHLAIRALVLGEHLDPNDLDWRRFVVAYDGDRLVGTVQMRRHPDGSRELGSLAVAADMRGQGIAARMIALLLADEPGPIQMITGAAHAAHYERFGFMKIGRLRAPSEVRRRYFIGQFGGAVLSFLQGRRPRRLAILQRAG